MWQNFLFSSFCEDYDTVLTTVFYFTWSLWMEDGSSMNEIKFKSYRAFTVIVPYLEGAECCVRVRCLNWFKNPPCSSLPFLDYPPWCRLHQPPPCCLHRPQEMIPNLLLRINLLLPCPCPLIPMDRRRVQLRQRGSEGAFTCVTHLKCCSNSNYLFVL